MKRHSNSAFLLPTRCSVGDLSQAIGQPAGRAHHRHFIEENRGPF